jgi:hypothetical protein
VVVTVVPVARPGRGVAGLSNESESRQQRLEVATQPGKGRAVATVTRNKGQLLRNLNLNGVTGCGGALH